MERLLELFCWSLSLSKGNKKRLARARPETLVEGIALITIHKKTPTNAGVIVNLLENQKSGYFRSLFALKNRPIYAFFL